MNFTCGQEYFLSVKRDIEQCAAGTDVESIRGNQKKKAVYTLKPMGGLRKKYITLANNTQ